MLASTTPPLPWKRSFCASCTVPDILLANACSNLVLRPRLARSFPFINQQVQVEAYCTKTSRAGFDPHVGCGECHPLPPIFDEDRLFSGDKP